jgi:hypothetical protein
MAILVASHSGDPIELLGRKKPSDKYMRYGAEIETGWRNSTDYIGYHEALSAAGLDNLVVSKSDGSISSSYGAEIVTVPLKLEELVEAVGRIGDVFEAQHKKAQIGGCGVHIHVSAKPLTEQARFRAMSAVMFDALTWKRCGKRAPNGHELKVAELNAFWDLVALRGSENYCSRVSMGRSELLRNSSHSYAAIQGYRKPTIEFRIFKTSRSAKVLRSYPEVAAAITAFAASNIAMPEPETNEGGIDRNAFAEKCMELYAAELWSNTDMVPILQAANCTSMAEAMVRFGINQGHYSESRGVQTSLCSPHYCINYQEHAAERVRWYHNHVYQPSFLAAIKNVSQNYGTFSWGLNTETIKGLFANIADMPESESTATYPSANTDLCWPLILGSHQEFQAALFYSQSAAGGMIALPYVGGLLPVREFTGFVLDQRSKYPNFARRLDLERFAPYRPGGTFVTVPDFDGTQPHDDLRVGCRLENQYSEEVARVIITDDKYQAKVKYENATNTAWVSLHDWNHVCEGASRLESWAE